MAKKAYQLFWPLPEARLASGRGAGIKNVLKLHASVKASHSYEFGWIGPAFKVEIA